LFSKGELPIERGKGSKRGGVRKILTLEAKGKWGWYGKRGGVVNTRKEKILPHWGKGFL